MPENTDRGSWSIGAIALAGTAITALTAMIPTIINFATEKIFLLFN